MRSLFFLILSLITLGYLAPISKAVAQLTPDTSLGAENSVVNPNVVDGVDLITGGSTRGSNLFHSFQDFNVDAGRGAYFSNPAGIANILTRVTGGNRSNIQGVLGVLGNANLLLINPKGISFGPNASLDLRGGSFFSTTADSVLFDNFEFSASNPQPVPQLTINIPIGLRFRDNPDSITNNVNTFGFGVQSGKTLALVGGNVSLDGGIVYAPGARVELGGLSQAGTVGLNPDGSLSFPSGVARSDVSFTNGAFAYVTAGGGGNIAINARNLDLLGGSGLFAGIQAGSNTPGAQAGDIVIDATDKVTIRGETNAFSRIINSVDGSSGITTRGNAGNVLINTASLEGSGGFFVGSFTNGQGNAGKVAITAKNQISLTGESNSSVFNFVLELGEGKGGDISVNADSLLLTNGAQIIATTYGKGDAGFVEVNVTKDATFDGVGSNREPSGVGSEVGERGQGNAGGIELSANNLFLKNGARISASTFGQGNAGAVKITAGDILSVDGIGSNNLSTQIATRVEGVVPESIGNRKGGDISINAGSLFLTNGGQINSSTSSKGNVGFINLNVTKDAIFDGSASNGNPSGIFNNIESGGNGRGGDVTIKAGNLSITKGAQIQTLVREGSNNTPPGQGNAGKVTINVDGALKLDGISDTFTSNGIDQSYPSLIATALDFGATGSAGEIEVSAGDLSITNGAQLYSSTSGNGNAGNVTLNIRKNAIFDGLNFYLSNGVPISSNSGVQSNVESGAIGNGGDVTIKAGNLSITKGAQIQTLVREGSNSTSAGQGNAGKVTINVDGALKLDGISDTFTFNGVEQSYPSLIATSLNFGATGRAGEIEVSAGDLSITNGALLFSTTSGNGNAGNVTLNIRNNAIFDGLNFYLSNGVPIISTSGVQSNVESGAIGNGGDVTIKAGNLSITKGAQIQTIVRQGFDNTLAGQGNAGKVTINVDGVLKLDGISDTFTFNGVNQSYPSLIATALDFGATGSAGEIEVSAGDLSITNGAQLFSSTFGNGNAGDVKINVRNDANFDGLNFYYSNGAPISSNSGIQSKVELGAIGKGGNIDLTAKSVSLSDGAQITVSSEGQGDAGNISIQAETLRLDQGKLSASTTSSNGGDITLNVRDYLFMRRNSEITTSAGTSQSGGNGGNIFINTLPDYKGFVIATPLQNSDITANAFTGQGGKIVINSYGIFGFVPRTRQDLQSLRPNDLDPRQISTNDITAFSQENSTLSGTVEINTLDVDPTQGLSELPENTTDPSNQIAQNPCQKGSGSAFIVTGRGGIPSSPSDSFNSDNVRVDLLQPITSNNNPQKVTNNLPKIQTATKEIIPAQGWIFNDKGEVVLTAYDPTTSGSQRSSQATASCPAPF